jgi:hypothetical protein
MSIAANGRFVTRVTPAQPSRLAPAAPWSQVVRFKVNARGLSLLGVQAQLQVSVANLQH